MNNFKYAINSLKKRKGINSIIFLQVILGIFFLSFSTSKKIELDNNLKQVNHVLKDRNVYGFVDKSDENNLIQNQFKQENSYDRLNEFYNFLTTNKKFQFVSFKEDAVFIDDFKGTDNLLLSNDKVKFKGFDQPLSNLKGFFIDKNFLNHFHFKVEKGRSFVEDDFIKGSNKRIPVVLGDNYKKLYKIGDEIRGNIQHLETFVIIGFLEKNYYFVKGINSLEPINLDNYMVIPYQNPIPKDEFFIGNFDTRIIHSFIITNNKEETMNLIQEKSRNLNLYTFNLVSYKDKLSNIVEFISSETKYTGFLFSIITLFSILGIVTSIMNSIQHRMKEFGVHILVGATLKDITLRIIIETAIVVIAGFLISTLLAYLLLGNISYIAWTFLTTIILIIVICIIPIYKMIRIDVNTLIKGKE
ncbi:ABC transporter permease [Bacillus cytotoxicus]|uniref:ABC transporter permease n=1 Tax=Bacillus cereus group TaxID=86661 RepID=UPI001F59A788|nr:MULTISPECIES: ABC transporter permease [Bacillus cereus group]EMA6341815.1 ABC transporter permease [Bacillus cytotoxicus]MDH2887015.1 ABC transporter permease [Bacillus cytotoxicus]